MTSVGDSSETFVTMSSTFPCHSMKNKNTVGDEVLTVGKQKRHTAAQLWRYATRAPVRAPRSKCSRWCAGRGPAPEPLGRGALGWDPNERISTKRHRRPPPQKCPLDFQACLTGPPEALRPKLELPKSRIRAAAGSVQHHIRRPCIETDQEKAQGGKSQWNRTLRPVSHMPEKSMNSLQRHWTGRSSRP